MLPDVLLYHNSDSVQVLIIIIPTNEHLKAIKEMSLCQNMYTLQLNTNF